MCLTQLPHPAAVCRFRAASTYASEGDSDGLDYRAVVVATSVTTPFVALYSTPLYYDLVARAESLFADGGLGGPEAPPPRF